MTEKQLADKIRDDLLQAGYKVIDVHCPQPNAVIYDSFHIALGKINDNRCVNGNIIFGFDVSKYDMVIERVTLLSIACSNCDYIRILLNHQVRNFADKYKYGMNEVDVIIGTMMKIGFSKGFISILARQTAKRFAFEEDLIDDLTIRFITENESKGLKNLLFMDWKSLIDEFDKQQDEPDLFKHSIKIDLPCLFEIQNKAFGRYLVISTKLNHPECTAVLLRWKHRMLDKKGDDISL